MAAIKNESLLITAALQVGLVDIDSVNDLRKVARQERKSIF